MTETAETKEEGLICGIVDEDTGISVTFPLETRNFFWKIEQKYIEFLKYWILSGPHRRFPKPVLYFEHQDGKKEFVKNSSKTERPLVLESKIFGEEYKISFFERTLSAIGKLFEEEKNYEALCCQ
jgi:hypothetical protein